VIGGILLTQGRRMCAAWRLSRVLKARKNGEKFGEDFALGTE